MAKKYNSESRLMIPCHWDRGVIAKILAQEEPKKGISVKEVYGVLASGGPVGHGRSRDSVAAVGKEEAVDFVRYLHSLGLEFTYLLNAPFRFKDAPEQRKQLDEYLSWILCDLKPDALMISSLELMRYVRKVDPEISIHISTIAGVKDIEGLQQFLEIRPERVVLHHDTGKEWDRLEEIVTFSKTNDIEIELMVTESCLFQCPNREAHYLYLSAENHDAPFHADCNFRKLNRPAEFLLAGGVIRPEDLSLYEGIGVRNFKVTGRSKPASWLPEVVEAYQNRSYEGNLIRLLGIDPTLRAEEWIYIENRALDDFLEGFPFRSSVEEKRQYSDQWMVRLYREGKFQILDGSLYQIQEGSLSLLGCGGEKAAPIVRKERGG